MLKNTVTEFVSGRLLTGKMLDSMNSHIDDAFHCYSNFPDGIIYGLDLSTDERGRIILKKGAVKHNKMIYFLYEDTDIQNKIDNECSGKINNGERAAVVFREDKREKSEKRIAESVYCESLFISVIRYSDKLEDDLVLFTFEYTAGFDQKLMLGSDPLTRIRNSLNETGGCINVAENRYSMEGASTFHPFIFERIAELIESKKNAAMLDYTVLSLIYQNKVIPKKTILMYLGKYSDRSAECLDGKELILSFAECINSSFDNLAYAKEKTVSENTEVRRAGRIR